MTSDPDPRIDAFLRAGRRRKVVAFATGGAVSMLFGLAVMIVAAYSHDSRAGGRDYYAVLLGLVAVIVGGTFIRNARRISTQEVLDVDPPETDPMKTRFL